MSRAASATTPAPTRAIDLGAEAAFARDLGRAFGGALIFTFPLLMTMEMWTFGATMDRARLAIFIAVSLPVLYGLSHYAGFRRDRGLKADLTDVATALAVGYATAAVLLGLFGLLSFRSSLDEVVGQLSLQAVPGAIGALLARRQLSGGSGPDTDDASAPAYSGELFLMVAGALFLALNVAPTEEMVLIAYKMSIWHTLALMAFSVLLLHVIVYSVGFAGQEEADRPITAFFHFTLVGYALALGVSLYILWTFGRTDGHDLAELVATVVVLGFPAALGAAAARLLV